MKVIVALLYLLPLLLISSTFAAADMEVESQVSEQMVENMAAGLNFAQAFYCEQTLSNQQKRVTQEHLSKMLPFLYRGSINIDHSAQVKVFSQTNLFAECFNEQLRLKRFSDNHIQPALEELVTLIDPQACFEDISPTGEYVLCSGGNLLRVTMDRGVSSVPFDTVISIPAHSATWSSDGQYFWATLFDTEGDIALYTTQGELIACASECFGKNDDEEFQFNVKWSPSGNRCILEQTYMNGGEQETSCQVLRIESMKIHCEASCNGKIVGWSSGRDNYFTLLTPCGKNYEIYTYDGERACARFASHDRHGSFLPFRWLQSGNLMQIGKMLYSYQESQDGSLCMQQQPPIIDKIIWSPDNSHFVACSNQADQYGEPFQVMNKEGNKRSYGLKGVPACWFAQSKAVLFKNNDGWYICSQPYFLTLPQQLLVYAAERIPGFISREGISRSAALDAGIIIPDDFNADEHDFDELTGYMPTYDQLREVWDSLAIHNEEFDLQEQLMLLNHFSGSNERCFYCQNVKRNAEYVQLAQRYGLPLSCQCHSHGPTVRAKKGVRQRRRRSRSRSRERDHAR